MRWSWRGECLNGFASTIPSGNCCGFGIEVRPLSCSAVVVAPAGCCMRKSRPVAVEPLGVRGPRGILYDYPDL
jgi:hypothetical protein